jgi:hypothetical protein
MTYNERINICKKLLSDVRDMIPDDEGKDDLSRVLTGLSEYVEGQAFLENTDEEKTIDSWNILLNTIEHCHEYVDSITEKLFPHPPKYITKDEAYGKLFEEYIKAFDEGDETVASMNINEWMDVNKYVIVDNDDARLESSSGGDDEESVNSRTPF